MKICTTIITIGITVISAIRDNKPKPSLWISILVDDLDRYAFKPGYTAVEPQERMRSVRFFWRNTTAEAATLTNSEIRNRATPMKKSTW